MAAGSRFSTPRSREATGCRRLERQAISPHEYVVIDATVTATGDTYDTQVECLVDDKPIDRRPIHLAAAQSEVIRFQRGDWSPGFHQVVVKLGTTDATLPFNDIRYATFLVRGSRKVLTITDHRNQSKYWTLALRAGRAFDSEVKLTSEAARLSPPELAAYRAVCLLGVAAPNEELWETLKQYVNQGGG